MLSKGRLKEKLYEISFSEDLLNLADTVLSSLNLQEKLDIGLWAGNLAQSVALAND
ncbi:hypothetical protein LCGC14_3066750 [marine sediment metagenome]|uniref:Uncharacterized protein n=1 Tax=marine sediment metagenome TaxID=412755 RepID=A0A0F8WH64_9ZZZZ